MFSVQRKFFYTLINVQDNTSIKIYNRQIGNCQIRIILIQCIALLLVE